MEDRSAVDLHLKIVSGDNAAPGKWPWQALLLITKGVSKKLSYCGGVLIHPRWVITAAHCVTHYSKIRIIFGVWNVSSKSEKGRVFARPARNGVHVHPCYDDYNALDDAGINLALIELHRSVSEFHSICFEKGMHIWKSLMNGKTLSGCVATGYGKEVSGNRAQVLQEVRFSNTSTESCRWHSASSRDKTVCAFDSRMTTRDACSGDLGGPLVCPTSSYGCNGYFLLGVTIAGNSPCGGDASRSPGIYAAIPPNMAWMRSVMQRNLHRNGKTAFFCNPKVQIKQTNKEVKTVGPNMRNDETSDDIM